MVWGRKKKAGVSLAGAVLSLLMETCNVFAGHSRMSKPSCSSLQWWFSVSESMEAEQAEMSGGGDKNAGKGMGSVSKQALLAWKSTLSVRFRVLAAFLVSLLPHITGYVKTSLLCFCISRKWTILPMCLGTCYNLIWSCQEVYRRNPGDRVFPLRCVTRDGNSLLGWKALSSVSSCGKPLFELLIMTLANAAVRHVNF